MDELTPQELNKFLSEFLITIRKKEDNEEYEPNSLRAFFASFERHLKKKKLWTLPNERRQVRANSESASSKQRDLKRKGKGNKPNASAALSEEDIHVPYEKDLLARSTAEALLSMVWFNNTIHFGLRGCKEHREMCWGDVKLCQTSTGQEYLEFNKRETKTRSGNDPRNVYKNHCTENVCCAEQREMSSKGLQSLGRKATRRGACTWKLPSNTK